VAMESGLSFRSVNIYVSLWEVALPEKQQNTSSIYFSAYLKKIGVSLK
jgi:hypothetical protein